MLALFLSEEFLLHIACWIHFYLGSFAYTSHPGFIFIWGVSLTHPVLASFLYGEFLIHIPSCLQFYARSLSYTFRAGFFFLLPGEFLLLVPCWFYFLAAEFLLHISCWLRSSLGSFSYTSRAGFIFIWGVSLTHPVLASFLSGECLLHTPCWLHFFYLGSFSYTSLAFSSFIYIFVLHIPFFFSFFFFFLFFFRRSFSYTSRAGFIPLWGVSLTHPVLASFLSGEFLLHIPCCLKNKNIFIIFISGEFLLHIPCWLLLFLFYVGRFSGMQSSLKTTPEEKSCVGDGPELCC